MLFAPQLNISRLAREGGAWHGTVDVAAFERLGEVLFNAPDSSSADAPSVSATLDFALDDQGRPWVRGTCNVVAPIVCSRCAETVDVEVESRVDFRVVATEAEVERLMPAFDAVVSEDESLSLTTLIEDDILLSIPETGCSDGDTCTHALEAGAMEHDADESKEKPFEALRVLVPGRRPA